MIHEKIISHRNFYRLNGDKKNKDVLQLVLGECDRIDSKRFLKDDEIVRLLKKMIDAEKTTQNRIYFIELLESYLPKQLDNEFLLKWLKRNVDFSQLKNKMAATGIVTKEFGSQVDGKIVSNLIKENF